MTSVFDYSNSDELQKDWLLAHLLEAGEECYKSARSCLKMRLTPEHWLRANFCHIYLHLSMAWNGRYLRLGIELPDDLFKKLSLWPTDLDMSNGSTFVDHAFTFSERMMVQPLSQLPTLGKSIQRRTVNASLCTTGILITRCAHYVAAAQSISELSLKSKFEASFQWLNLSWNSRNWKMECLDGVLVSDEFDLQPLREWPNCFDPSTLPHSGQG